MIEYNDDGVIKTFTDWRIHQINRRSVTLDRLLGKRVRIKFKDGDSATGKLEYGTDSHYPKAYKIIRDDGEYDTVFYKSNIKTASEDNQ